MQKKDRFWYYKSQIKSWDSQEDSSPISRKKIEIGKKKLLKEPTDWYYQSACLITYTFKLATSRVVLNGTNE